MNNRLFKSYILLSLAWAFALPAAAQSSDSYAQLNKTATFNYETQQGEITLESYVTGVSKITQEAKPVDVVMVLDYSGSMTSTYGVDSTYQKVVANVRYSGNNIKSQPSGSSTKTSWYNDTQSRIGQQLFDSNNNAITKTYNGTTYNVYGIHIIDPSWSASDDSKTTNSFRNWAYITISGTRYFLRLDGSLMKEKGTTTVSWSTWPTGEDDSKIYPAHLNERTIFASLTETTAHTTNRAAALQFAAGKFVEAIANHAGSSSVINRIAIVSFQTGGTHEYPTIFGSSSDYITPSSDYYLMEYPSDKKASGSTDNNLEGRSLIVKRFVDISSPDAVKTLKYAISDIENKGNTPVHLGMDLAYKLIDEFGRTDKDVAKFVILFSDGEPTQNEGSVWNSEQGADKAVANAYSIKNGKGWNIYSIYCNSTALSSTDKTYKFLDYCSSNYPEATAYNSGTHDKVTAEVDYFKTAQDNLAIVFEGLTTEITEMAGTQYGTETLLKDFVNNTYFKMPNDIVKSDIKVYEQACTAVTGTSPNIVYTFDNICDDATNRCWQIDTSGVLPDASTRPRLNITIQKVGDSGYSGSQDRVLISGYDYSAEDNWCGLRKTKTNPTGTPGGHRLVVKFPYEIKVESGATATGALKTNGEDSGIYEAIPDDDGNEPGDPEYTPTYDDDPETAYPMPVIYFASLNITRTGLDPGESAIYDIYQTMPGGTETKVGCLSINGSGTGTDSKIMYGLAGGVGVAYRVVETDWNWAYHNSGTTPQQTQTIQQKSSSESTVPLKSNLDFNFSGAHITTPAAEEATSPYSMHNHDEEYQINIIDVSDL